MTSAIPPDNLPSAEKDRLLTGWPKEAERDIDMLHLEWLAWLVVTGRLAGDTEPRVMVDVAHERIVEHLANLGDAVTYRDEVPKPGPPYTGGH